MNEHSSLVVESSAVQKHLEIMQGVSAWPTTVAPARFGASPSCQPSWCWWRAGKAEHALIALAPTVLFYVLDAYYLALERGFRRSPRDSSASCMRNANRLGPLQRGPYGLHTEGHALGDVQVLLDTAVLRCGRRYGGSGVASNHLTHGSQDAQTQGVQASMKETSNTSKISCA